MNDTVRYALAFAVPFAVTWATTPAVARVATRVGLVDHPTEGRHHKSPTPYLGGLAVAAGFVLIAALAGGAEGQLLTILLCGLVVGCIGLVDDVRTVKPLVKVAIEGACGVALWIAGIRAGFFGIYVLDLALTVGWVVVVTNALNLLDNMDGLSSGVVAISASTFFVIAAQRGDYLVGSFAIAVAGASLGFLRHNFPPAKVFLGDAGSLMLGFFLAGLALKLDLVGPRGPVRAAIVVLVLGVPLFDMTLVIIARLRERRPIYIGGTDHASHRLVMRGLSPRTVAFVTYGAQVALCGIALALARAPHTVILTGMGLVAAVAVAVMLLVLHLPHPGMGGKDVTVLPEVEEEVIVVSEPEAEAAEAADAATEGVSSEG
jgi:UDP-GlcNAc:undecaprenyl-phosphate GlcNAc-1-phosphate transferase